VPRAVAFEAELGVAVGAGDGLRGVRIGGLVTGFRGEVEAAVGGEAGDEVGVGCEECLSESSIVPAVVRERFRSDDM
jgi:hypothetical protein